VGLTSRTRIAAGIGLSGLIAAAAVAAPAPAAMKRKPRQVTCDLTLYATIRQPAATAANFGSARCGSGFGSGVQQDSSTVKRTALAAGTFAGPFKMFFDHGTIGGTFSIGFVTTLAPATYAITGVMYKGTLKVTAGTGSYRRARGAGTVVGTSPDAVKTTLVYKLGLTGV
jgi:hypothetical protein